MGRPGNRRYLTPWWDEVRLRSGMTDRQVIAVTQARYEWAIGAGIRSRAVLMNRLDNPFMQLHARDTIIADMRKFDKSKRAKMWRDVGAGRVKKERRAA